MTAIVTELHDRVQRMRSYGAPNDAGIMLTLDDAEHLLTLAEAATTATHYQLRYHILATLLREGAHSIEELGTRFLNHGIDWDSSTTSIAGQLYAMTREQLPLTVETQIPGVRRWILTPAAVAEP